MKTITSHKQAIENIKQFNREVDSFLHGSEKPDVETLVKNIPHYRAWYCLFDESSNEYLFAPSKYIGYSGIDAATYYEYNRNGLDGRQTENVLSNWYETISVNHNDFELLSKKLREFCIKFDKSPNSLFRINIPLAKSESSGLEKNVIEFILSAYESLSDVNRTDIRNRINKYKN